MAETRKRTLVEFGPGSFEPLRRDLKKYKRGGLRLKQLATLGLAAEAIGLSCVEDGDRVSLVGMAVSPALPPFGAQKLVDVLDGVDPPSVASVPSAADEFLSEFTSNLTD